MESLETGSLFIYKKGGDFKMFQKIMQYFCKHKYRKRYNHKSGTYERKCIKCGKRG